MARTLYRYAVRFIEIGGVMVKDGDHIDRLKADQLAAERALRSVSALTGTMRENALYAWTDYELAKQSGAILGRPYLYTVQVEDSDVLFESDLQHYTDIVEAIKASKDPSDAIRRYWENAPISGSKPRIEVLFTTGTVLKRESLPTKEDYIRQKISGTGGTEEFDPLAG